MSILPVWRLIPHFEAPGHCQMALDSWLLEQHRLGLQPPTLRFYTWSPAAISLGYHQRRWLEHWQHLTWQGSPLDLVRRPTGGRAVLHQGDLTYAIVTSGLSGDRLQVYQTICEFLIQGWKSLGVALHYGQAGRSYLHNPNCFGTATKADLILDSGDKLIGSAQVYREGTVLQHGSIRLAVDATLFAQVFGVALPAVKLPPMQQESAISILIQTLVDAAEDCFGIKLIMQPLSQAEWQAVLSQPRLELRSAKQSGTT